VFRGLGLGVYAHTDREGGRERGGETVAHTRAHKHTLPFNRSVNMHVSSSSYDVHVSSSSYVVSYLSGNSRVNIMCCSPWPPRFVRANRYGVMQGPT